MLYSIPIGKILGIHVRIHFLFILFFILFSILSIVTNGLAGLIFVIIYALTFVFVFLHELGHSLVARAYGIHVKDITLWPLGGIANIETQPREPTAEIMISIAGPLVNFIIALILSPIALISFFILHTYFFIYLVYINVILMLFNFIPAFPMDGGRIYRAFLAKKIGYLEATRKAVSLGKIIAIIMGVLGIFAAPTLLAIALFIVIAGEEELRMIEVEYYNRGFTDLNSNPFFFFYLPPKYQDYYGPSYINIDLEELERFIDKYFNKKL